MTTPNQQMNVSDDLALPLGLTVKIQATNGNTTRYALEAVVDILKKMRMPQAGQVIDDEYWRVTIIEVRNRLPDVIQPK